MASSLLSDAAGFPKLAVVDDALSSVKDGNHVFLEHYLTF